VSAVFNHDTGTNWAASLGVTTVMKEDMEKVFAPVMELSPPDKDHEGPVFTLRVVQGLSGGGSDHASFLAANVPGLNWSLTGRSDYFGYTWHSQYDTYDVAIPEYQAHNATVFALAALGTANLPGKLNRDGLRAASGGGDATVMLSGYFGAEFEGMKIKSLEKEGLMAKAGIEAGDVIKGVNGKPVTALIDILRIGRDDGLDKGIELTVDRGGKEVKVKMSIENAPGRRGRRRGGE
jgi:membrane-associated protease RseP (regulator of RpoE activity)